MLTSHTYAHFPSWDLGLGTQAEGAGLHRIPLKQACRYWARGRSTGHTDTHGQYTEPQTWTQPCTDMFTHSHACSYVSSTPNLHMDTDIHRHMLTRAHMWIVHRTSHMDTNIHIHAHRGMHTHMWIIHRTSHMDTCVYTDTHMIMNTHTHKSSTQNPMDGHGCIQTHAHTWPCTLILGQ